MIKLFIAFTLLLLQACTSRKTPKTTPMLWEITGNHLKKSSYIFGTFHTRDSNINKLPKSVLSSLYHSQRLYTEISMSKKSTQKIMQLSKLSKPKPLKKRLNQQNFKTLSLYLKKTKHSSSLSSLQPFKTWAIALMLSNQEDAYANKPFMDEHLVDMANGLHIKHMGLETPLEQLYYFDSLSTQEEELFLLDTLVQNTNNHYRDALESWYKKGKAHGFMKIQKEFESNNIQQKHLNKKLFQGLIYARNDRFLRRIDILLQSSPDLSYFFAIGAGHLSGDKGLINRLKILGYELNKLD